MRIVTRQDAISRGLVKYFTGVPCIHGHLTERRVNNRNCMGCWSDMSLEWAVTAKQAKKNDQRKNQTKRNKRYYDKHRADILNRTNKWKSQNLNKCRAHNAKRRAVKLQCTPKWSEVEAIKKFYENCPKGYQVDHIVPLNSDVVCGLHVIANLQYLTVADNARKGNKLSYV